MGSCCGRCRCQCEGAEWPGGRAAAAAEAARSSEANTDDGEAAVRDSVPVREARLSETALSDE
jgi:hypothetical protein